VGAEWVDFVATSPAGGDLEVRWIHGSPIARRNTDAPIQIHAYNSHTFILRQNKAVHYEAPFVYLFCGNDRALLLDTGATADPALFPLRDTVEGIVRDWLTEHPRDNYELVVAHTHAHGDHIAGDPQLDGRPNTTVVAPDLASVREYFGITDWPEEIVTFDLGGRVLDIFGVPGHHDASIAIYDRWTGFLLTGDTVYPGRLYVKDFTAFAASIARLIAFAESHPVSHVMGCHIEMTRAPGRDYPITTTYQPNEPALQMTLEQLKAVGAATATATRPGVHRFDDFVIFNGPCKGAVLRQLARARWGRLRDRLASPRRPAP